VTPLARATGTGSWFALSQGLKQAEVKPRGGRTWRWGATILLGAWLLTRLALSMNLPGSAIGPTRTIITVSSLGFGLLAGILPLLISPVYRQIVRAIPETWTVSVHAVRIGGFLFLALMDMKLLPPQFALPAGYGDVSVGLLALCMVYLLAQKKPYARTLVLG